jgi:hypothetical protein
MNIQHVLSSKPLDCGPVICPGCHCRNCRKHAVYIRKWFHVCGLATSVPITVQRYRCLNPACPRCTFSVLPPMVLRYCRFFWPCLLTLIEQHSARQWDIGSRVIKRATTLVKQMHSWVETIYREVSDGGVGGGLGRMVKIIVGRMGFIELSNRWYRHRYPLRFLAAADFSHNLPIVNRSSGL